MQAHRKVDCPKTLIQLEEYKPDDHKVPGPLLWPGGHTDLVLTLGSRPEASEAELPANLFPESQRQRLKHLAPATHGGALE